VYLPLLDEVRRMKLIEYYYIRLDIGSFGSSFVLAMFIDQLAKLQKAKAELAVAEAKLASDRVNALAQLPSQYGFNSLNDFLKAVKAAYGKGGKAAKGKKSKAKASAPRSPTR
jgi:hypothetical protein